MENDFWTCSICGRTSSGWGHNPQPVRDDVDARCCEVCNATIVIPARMKEMVAKLDKL